MRPSFSRLHFLGGLFLLALLCAALAGPKYFLGDAATLIVTIINDSGPGSLRQALADVPDGGTIQFNSALNGQAITLTSAELVVSKSITITGLGPAFLTVARNQQTPNFRIFNVPPGHIVVISGLTITGGHLAGENGGGIMNDQSTLTISNCAISGNGITATGSQFRGGGGIYNIGTLSLVNSTVSSNTAIGGWSQGGGGIYNDGTLTITQSTISGNSADEWAGGIASNGMLMISHSIISNNQTHQIAHYTGRGGGIANGGTLIIDNSIITGNMSGHQGGSVGGYGGGIYSNGGSVTITNSTIIGNTGLYQGGGFYGGGTITNSTISGNTANIGGGIYGGGTISNSTISGNTANQGGGGIYGGGTITNSTISGNTANQGGGIYAINAVVELGNTILKAGPSGANIFNNGTTVTSHGYNLSSDNGGGFLTGPGDQINTDPLLGPLQNNGGPTVTQELLAGSPAINAGDPDFTPPPFYDQRDFGYLRVYNGRIDIGSFEVQPLPTVSPTPTATATGTPLPTPTPTPTPCLPVLTQSSSQAITPGNSASCNDGVTHTDNSYWRAFDMTAYAGGGQYCVNSVSFGVEFANTSQPVTVRLYTTSNFPAGFPGSLTQIATTTLNVGSVQNGTVVTAPLVVTVPAGTPQLVMELFTPNGQPGGYRFFVGSNAALETGPSYFSAPACGITTPTTTAAAGFPNMHIVFDVNGSCACPTPTPTPCDGFNVSGTVGQCTTAGPSGVALAGVTMTLTSIGQSTSTTTNGSGNYFLAGSSCVTNTLTPSKAALAPGSAGIDTVDVIALQKHFLIIGPPLLQCRAMAADVNGVGGVNTVDVIATQRFFLGLATGIANVGKYQFAPASRSYSPPISNQTGQNYDAIVFGDVVPPYATP